MAEDEDNKEKRKIKRNNHFHNMQEGKTFKLVSDASIRKPRCFLNKKKKRKEKSSSLGGEKVSSKRREKGGEEYQRHWFELS